MKVALHVLPFSRDLRDHDLVCRGAAIEQVRADIRIEREWRRRVRDNENRRLAANPKPF